MPHDASNNIIVVGPARSGTTLACSLLNDPVVTNTVALDEPWERDQISGVEPDAFVSFMDEEFRQFRRQIHEESAVTSTLAGRNLGNHYDAAGNSNGVRKRVAACGTLKIDKALDEDCNLIIKHTIPFTGMVDQLRARYPTFAVVRNPLSVIASWNTIDAPYRDGRLPQYAAHLCGDMPFVIGAFRDLIERQVILLSWHMEQYVPLLDDGSVVRYEEMIESGGKCFGTIVNGAGQLCRPLKCHNRNSAYPTDLIAEINLALHRVGGPVWNFYSRDEVDELTEDFHSKQRKNASGNLV